MDIYVRTNTYVYVANIYGGKTNVLADIWRENFQNLLANLYHFLSHY